MRVPRDKRLETREARRRLPDSRDPYWRSLGKGIALGYRRGMWWVRERKDGHYRKRSLAKADDHAGSDGREVLSYREACGLAYAGEQAQQEARAGAYTVGDAMEGYLDWYRAHRKAVRTTTRAIQKHILPELGDRDIGKLTARELRKWHEAIADSRPAARSSKVGPKRYRPVDESVDEEERRRRRKATANRVLTILKAGLSHAFREGYVDDDLAWRRVKPFREVDVPRIRYLNTGEAKRLINVCEPDFQVLVNGALVTGCRFGELRRLRVHDFNADSGTISIQTSKGGKPRTVPLTEEGIELLEELTAGRLGNAYVFTRTDGKPWGPGQQVRRMKDACAAAKLKPPVCFNELRHTFASILAMRGVGLDVIADVLGHSDTRMTKKHYVHLSPSHVSEQIRANLPRFSSRRPKVRRMK